MQSASARAFRFILLTAVLITIAGACSDDKSTDPPAPPTGNVMLHFVHVVDGDTLELNQMKYRNAAGDTFMVQNLEYFVSKIGMEGPDGSYVPANAHYVRADDPSTFDFLLTGVPEAHYHSLVLTFGLDESMNSTSNETVNQIDGASSMIWPQAWGGGYHYMRLEGRFKDQGTVKGFLTHTGRYADATRPAENHYFQVGMTVHKNVVADETVHIAVVMNLAPSGTRPPVPSISSITACSE
ncbi:MAG: MbnP family protein [Candidatus Eisenbacteria bacterium]